MSPDEQPSGRQFDRLEMLAVAYLCLPVPLFLLGWLRLPYALALLALLALAIRPLWINSERQTPLPTRPTAVAAAAVALAWVVLSGLAGGFHLNTDWLTRMSLLRDLVVADWPVTYDRTDQAGLILRCPLGYYLVPALAGKLSSLDGARLALCAWTVLGVWLFLLLLLDAPVLRRRGMALALLVAVLFSGMDVVGWLLVEGQAPAYGDHIEWWAGQFQYSSQTTLLFWVPNHAIPGWLAAMVAWRHRRHGLAPAPAAMLVFGMLLWAPLVALGAAPLLLCCVLQGLQGRSARSVLRELCRPALLALAPPALVVARFLTMGAMPMEAAARDGDGPGVLLLRIAIFSTLEWALLALVLLWMRQRTPLLLLALLELLLLPLLKYGPGNDIVMRGAIAPLTVLLACAAEALAPPSHRQVAGRAVLAALLLVGSVTPLLEMERAMLPGPDYRNDGKSLVDINGMPWHYVTRLDQPDMIRLMRPAHHL